MKTIKVTDEMYEFLMNLSKEMNEQDHRGTRMPYFFQVQTQHRVSVPEGSGIQAWHCDGCMLETEEEIKELVVEQLIEMGLPKLYADMRHDEIDTFLESLGYEKVCYDYEPRYENSFLTSKACDEHIKANKHNLSDPVNYLSYANRNPEMEMLQKFLCELSGGKLHE